jgi:CheY-like chemotaxis protein
MKKLVVVDDESEIRSMIKVMLSGYDIEELETANDVLEYCKQNPVDLIITDLFMPEKSGLDLIELINEMENDIKILAISGGSRRSKCDFLPVAGLMGAETLHKPFTPTELREKVAELLN